MEQNSQNRNISEETDASENSPVDLTMQKSESSRKRSERTKRRMKKFAKLNISEDAMEERRRTANDLERKRMRKMSQALDELRKCIPEHFHLCHRRMSKIRTLRLAASYIRALNDMLQKDIMKEMVQNAYRNIHYNLIKSPVVHPGVTVNVAPSPTSGTPSIGHLFHTPRRQLNFLPGYPGFQTPNMTPGGPHPVYQTPDPSDVASYTQAAPRSWHRPCHTITSPPCGEDDDKVYVGSTSVSENTTNMDFPRVASSCRYGHAYMDGVFPLPEDNQAGE